MKNSFQTILYKCEWVQCDSEGVKWRGKPYKSLHAAKCAITRAFTKRDMEITKAMIRIAAADKTN